VFPGWVCTGQDGSKIVFSFVFFVCNHSRLVGSNGSRVQRVGSQVRVGCGHGSSGSGRTRTGLFITLLLQYAAVSFLRCMNLLILQILHNIPNFLDSITRV
jgi:hypothetical protein